MMQASPRSLHYRFDFLKYRYVGAALSIGLLVTGLVFYFIKGGFSYHIDFTGGAEIRVLFEKPLKISQIRSTMNKQGWKDSVIQEIGVGQKEFIIRIRELDDKLEGKVKKSLTQSFPDNKVTINNVEWVGAEAGKDTKWNAVKAVFLSLIILLLYIAIRSEFSFAVGAIAALVHDVLMVLVFLLLVNEQVSLHVLASVLAVLGYSLNDSIVIFSKIRENFKKLRGASEYDIINLSINQMLKRTILTSVSTFLAILSILILGGEALRAFSTIMVLGVVVGTYSSIYIASSCILAVRAYKKTAVSESTDS